MYKSDIFFKFCNNRNIKDSTMKGYESALKKYSNFCKKSIDELLDEALKEELDVFPLKNRKIRERLIDFRGYLLKSNLSSNTVKTYFSKIKTFYQHFGVEVPLLPNAKYEKTYETNYLDLPSKDHIKQVLNIVSLDFKAIILFMISSGTAKAEVLSLTVRQFVEGTRDYHNGGSLDEILNSLDGRKDIVPTFYLRRIKTDKFYYTFCSPEASFYMVSYLKLRPGLSLDDPLFDISDSLLLSKFQDINDRLGWGFKGHYRFFRSHALRKFHASNIGLVAEYIDSLQGRSKDEVHETYIKTNPEKLKEIYMSAMKNVMVFDTEDLKNEIKQDFTIVVNVFLSGKEYNIM